MNVFVYPSDFQDSTYENPKNCPLYKAILRLYPNQFISVTVGAIYVTINNHVYKINDWIHCWNESTVKGFIKQPPKSFYIVELIKL